MISAFSKAIPSIPKETVQAVRASFGRGNFYIQVGEQLDAILADMHWERSPKREGFSIAETLQPGLITFFQFMEGLTDGQASDALRTRLDWKFALHLSLLPRTLDQYALCRFREEILSDPLIQPEYQVLVDRLVRYAPSLQDRFHHLRSVELVSQVCWVNRLDEIQQAMNRVLEVLAVRFPQWLRTITLPHWYGRYYPGMGRSDGTILPGGQRFFMEEIGLDIQYLLEKIRQASSREIGELEEVRSLEHVWLHQLQAWKPSHPDHLELLSHQDCEDCSHKGGKYKI
jgi:transposase